LENGTLSIIWIISIQSVRLKRKTSQFEFDCLDGVVLVDPEYVKDRKVYASVLAGNKTNKNNELN